jgi:NADH-quinone oxidoreductase subunit B
MRIQDQIKGQKIAKRPSPDSKPLARGVKVDDQLPLPHHSGYVTTPPGPEPLRSHQDFDD